MYLTLAKRPRTVAVAHDSGDEMYTEVVYLDDQTEEDIIQEDENNEENAEEFYCSSCNINISSVEEHIQEYHFGENIVVEVICLLKVNRLYCLRMCIFRITGSTISEPTRVCQA